MRVQVLCIYPVDGEVGYVSQDSPVRVTPRLLFEPVWFPKLDG